MDFTKTMKCSVCSVENEFPSSSLEDVKCRNCDVILVRGTPPKQKESAQFPESAVLKFSRGLSLDDFVYHIGVAAKALTVLVVANVLIYVLLLSVFNQLEDFIIRTGLTLALIFIVDGSILYALGVNGIVEGIRAGNRSK
jgi:hypothetical protein